MTAGRGALLVWLATVPACSAAPGGLPAGAAPAAARVRADGALSGAAIGYALGSEAHVFLADSAFASAVYTHLLRPALAPEAPPTLAAALGTHGVLAVSADRFRHRDRPARASDADVIHPRGRVPARLILVRLHRPGHCSVPEYVTELVLEVPEWARALAPPPHAPVVAVLHAPRTVPREAPSPDPTLGPALGTDAARTLVSIAALSAESVVTRAAALPPGAPLPIPVALDADRAADAGEVLLLPGGAGRAAIGLRVRFLTPLGDTVLVSGVALADTLGRGLTWVLAPTRAALDNGLSSVGGRYSLRAALSGPPAVLLVDEIVDVAAAASRVLVIDPRRARVLAARPLALRCP